MRVLEKGDFSATRRLLWISSLAGVIGALCAFVALALIKLIAVFTNLLFYGRFSTVFRSPAANTLGWWVLLIPVAGGLIVGLMARYGAERIRGHGIPEALESILFGKSKMSPKIAVLKPLSAAVSIGSGGPFGAEGPIIMTGGSIGSLLAQAFRVTGAERKTLLVAGAAAGMSATFETPLAAILLAVELLLFEWRPRNLIPVSVASAVAAALRPYFLGPPPLFPLAPHPTVGTATLLSSLVLGLSGGLFSLLLTESVYFCEDLFNRFRFHWMWWPALGGLAIGVGGLLQPHALGVGYDIIGDILHGRVTNASLWPLTLVKWSIWSISLGSGTSGGVLAPLLLFGGGLGGLEAKFLSGGDPSLWALVGMGAVLGGTMRSPLTAVIFALELTHDVNALPALLVAAIAAHGFTVLLMKRSILTEKVARRGYHVFREYSVDLLERVHVQEVMTQDVVVIPGSLPVDRLAEKYFGPGQTRQGYPVVDGEGRLMGVVTRSDLLKRELAEANDRRQASDLITHKPIIAFPHETCRVAATRMAKKRVGRLPVVSPEDPRRVVGIVTRSDLLKPSVHYFDQEIRQERLIRI